MADFGGAGLPGQFPLEQWFYEMPVCTRYLTTAVVATSVLVQCHVVSPFNLFYSFRAVWHKGQYWRLLTTFIYFGPLTLDLVFHVFFLQRYSRLLEESSGRSPARFAWLLIYSVISLLCLAPVFSLAFLGTGLSSVLLYIWSRRNPDTLLNFLGFFIFKAQWLPFVHMALTFVLNGNVPKDDICGCLVGHVYYYFNDIYPPTHNGSRPFEPPRWWANLFERPQIETAAEGDQQADTRADNIDAHFAAAGVAEVR